MSTIPTKLPSIPNNNNSRIYATTPIEDVTEQMDTKVEEDIVNAVYWVNNFPVTVGFLITNVVIILVHIGMILLNSSLIAALRRSRKGQEPNGHALISKSFLPIDCLIFLVPTKLMIRVNSDYYGLYLDAMHPNYLPFPPLNLV